MFFLEIFPDFNESQIFIKTFPDFYEYFPNKFDRSKKFDVIFSLDYWQLTWVEWCSSYSAYGKKSWGVQNVSNIVKNS